MERNRIGKLEVLSAEIRRQYEEIRESRSEMMKVGAILTAINIYLLTNYTHFLLLPCFLLTLYYAYKLFIAEPVSIGVEVSELTESLDRSELELKETIVSNLKDSMLEQSRLTREKANYYGKLLIFSFINYALFILLSLLGK